MAGAKVQGAQKQTVKKQIIFLGTGALFPYQEKEPESDHSNTIVAPTFCRNALTLKQKSNTVSLNKWLLNIFLYNAYNKYTRPSFFWTRCRNLSG